MGVPLRQLLVAVHNINRVVDVQDNRPRWILVTSAPDIYQGKPGDGSPNKQQAPIILGAKP